MGAIVTRVLVVHADSEAGAELARAIEQAGHAAHLVTSGERAMDAFVQEPADVVVIDYHLAGRDGVSTAEAIRWMPGGRRARLVITSASEPADGSLRTSAARVEPFEVHVGDLAPVVSTVDRAARMRPAEGETLVLDASQLAAHARRTAPGNRLSPVDRDWELRTAPGDPVDTTDEDPDAWAWRDMDGRREGAEVDAVAQRALRGSSALSGGFDDMPFARLLHRVAEARASGVLVCVHPPDGRTTTEGPSPIKLVYLRAGAPVYVRSNVESESLRQVLVRQDVKGERPGEVGPLELSAALAVQAQSKLFDLFGWRRGTFRLTDAAPAADPIEIEMGLAEIVLRGIARALTPERVRELLNDHLDRVVLPQPRQLVRFMSLELPGAMRDALARIDGARSLREVMGADDGAARLLYAMECLEAVRFGPAEARLEGTVVARRPRKARPRADPAAADPAGILDERVDRLLQAERHFRRGQRSLERGKAPEAIAALERAAELCPQDARFLATLAWAEHSAAGDDAFVLTRALEKAERSCALAPDLALAHLMRARLLEAASRAAEARDAYARVVELDTDHEEARARVSALSRPA